MRENRLRTAALVSRKSHYRHSTIPSGRAGAHRTRTTEAWGLCSGGPEQVGPARRGFEVVDGGRADVCIAGRVVEQGAGPVTVVVSCRA